ncbi:MAG: HD domain-containing protein, partial [Treponema sp.]|nr:HD domain-containing protein [Treponema sp.]
MENRLETLRNEIDRLIFEGAKSENIRMYISHMYGVARFCTLLAMKRKMNIEIATTCGMLHDIYYMTGKGSENHALKGSKQAEEILKTMKIYNENEIKIITSAISKHSDKSTIHDPYDELLKDADVMDHCFYNIDFSIAEGEKERYKNIL